MIRKYRRTKIMEQRVKAYIQNHHMLKKGEKIVVGVSGGADSVCLLFLLLNWRKEWDLKLQVVHVHHGLRGIQADADEQYVRKLCEEYEVPLCVFHEDVKVYARERGMTEEEAGRVLRRERFVQVKQETNASKIVLAHHKNDNVETMLWNLSRGSGLRGAGGIRPVNGAWIRPLLCVTREEIERYLNEHKIVYCEDETNQEDAYTRNRLRNHVIPYLQNEVNARAVEHIADAIEQFRMVGEYLEKETDRYVKTCIRRRGETWILQKESFEQVPEVMQSYVLYEILGEVAGQKKDLAQVHVQIVKELLEKQVGRRCDLPYQIQVQRCYEGLEICKKAEGEEEVVPEMEMRIFSKEECKATFPENPYTKWFDYDIIKGTVTLRHRESGDYIVINKSGGTKKLKQYFVDEKVPQKEREKVWLVAEGKQIMWIVGYRQSQKYQITDHTRTILEVKINGGETWQRQ